MTDVPPAPKRGWPRGLKRGPRKVTLTPPEREVAKEPMPSAAAEYKDPKSKWGMKNAEDWGGDFVPDVVTSNVLDIPRSDYPEGMDLKWVTESVLEKPIPERLSDAHKSGWRVVDSTDWDNKFKGRFSVEDGPVRYHGLILCARPMWISDRFRKQQEIEAAEPIRIKERALMGGDIPNVSLDSQHKSALATNKIKKTVERIEIPKD